MNTTSTVADTSSPPDAPAARRAHGTSALLAKMKILVIDDEPANVALLEGILADSGYTQVQTVTDSRSALDACKTFPPDLILLDLMMPHVDGFSLLQSFRSEVGEIFLPIVVLTADVNEETKLRALSAGATDFLLKPFDHLEVLLRIGNLLEMRRLHLQLDNQLAAFEDAVRARTSELRDALSKLEESRDPKS
jgi:putative two-component system response regulator